MVKVLDSSVEVPVEDMTAPGDALEPLRADPGAGDVREPTSVWPAVEQRVLELVERHRSTIVFVNSRLRAERLCARLNELAGEDVDAPTTGRSVRAQRAQLDGLRARPAEGGRGHVVAGARHRHGRGGPGGPGGVAAVGGQRLQRIGRAGHRVGEPSVGVIFPKFRGDLVSSAVVVERMRDGAIEETHMPRNPLDVLAQQVVAMVALEDRDVDHSSRP